MFTIRFLNPNARIEGKEMRSKLLEPSSELYGWLQNERKIVCEKYENVDPQRMDFHIELISKTETPSEELLVSRAKQLEGSVCDSSQKVLIGKTYMLPCPAVQGYGDTHITIAHFPAAPEKFEI